MADPYGYYARKALSEAAIRAAAPYQIDDQGDVFPDFDSLSLHLENSGHLVPGLEPSSDGTFAYYDAACGYRCGTINVRVA
jgi:hypothetical protein